MDYERKLDYQSIDVEVFNSKSRRKSAVRVMLSRSEVP
jgi:hypothetical protein